MNRWTLACLATALACSAPLFPAHAQIGTRLQTLAALIDGLARVERIFG